MSKLLPNNDFALWQLLGISLLVGGMLFAVAGFANSKADREVVELTPEQFERLEACGLVESTESLYQEESYSPERSIANKLAETSIRSFVRGVHIPTGDSEAAIVVFAVIGIVTVLAVIPYGISYLYEVLNNQAVCYRHETGFSLFLTDGKQNLNDGSKAQTSTQYVSFRYSVSVERGNSADLGLTAELGHQRMTLNGSSSDTNEGTYFLLGPKFYFARSLESGSHGYLEFLGGNSLGSKLGSIAKAKLGIMVFPSRFSDLGFSLALGSIYNEAEIQVGLAKTAASFNSFLEFGLILKD